MDKTYNGWTNYATWRVNLEIFDGSDWHCRYDDGNWPDAYDLAQELKQYAEEIITDYKSETNLAQDYALAFLSDVNWHQIAQHMIAYYAEEA
jgi:hypothetical protein